jgi:prolyl 4-hydroxylase
LPHQDAFTSETDLEWTKMKPSNGGQRIIACFVFLNTVQQGGELFFPKIDLRIEAQQGRAVIFDTVFAGTNKPHSLSENSILPVIDGEKWCFKIWFREKNIVP